MKTVAVIFLLLPLIFWVVAGMRFSLLVAEAKKLFWWYLIFGTFYFAVA